MRRLIWPLLFGIGGTAILLGLGFWQLQRLDWKLGIVQRIESRLSAEAVPVPAAPNEADDEYLRVRESGELLPGEVHIYTSAPPRGVGYRIIAPVQLADGRRILVDRGFVPIEEKDAERPVGPVTIEGVLLWPDESDLFSSKPDLGRNIWINRSVPRMAEVLETEPVLLVAASSDIEGGPEPLPVTPNIRNQHLEYAITWFGLAAVWAGMTGYLLWRIKRRTV